MFDHIVARAAELKEDFDISLSRYNKRWCRVYRDSSTTFTVYSAYKVTRTFSATADTSTLGTDGTLKLLKIYGIKY